jgi:hypothetical protein
MKPVLKTKKTDNKLCTALCATQIKALNMMCAQFFDTKLKMKDVYGI